MNFIDLLKDIFGGANYAFSKLTPEYFSLQRANLRTEEYAQWLSGQLAKYSAIAYIQKEKGRFVPPHWVTGLRLIEDEIEKIKTQGTSHLFSPDMTKASDDFK